MNNFITNQSNANELKKRINDLISKSKELKFLIGFFYFSGIRELYESIKSNDNVILKVLVGLNVDFINGRLSEFALEEKMSDEEREYYFYESIKNSINTDLFDSKEFFEQVKFFLSLIYQDRLLIRKTYDPNHAKLYIFKLKEDQIVKNCLFITGSSNLTKAGLTIQNEFNVEISDYGIEDAEKYFDGLWNKAVKINEFEDGKKRLIDLLEEETLVKQITPFEAFVFVLKTYLDTYEHKSIGTSIIEILEKNGYKKYEYQLDAVRQALSIIEKHNGVLIADVVGLGKTIIACAIGKHLRKRGVIICPPGLIGDNNKKSGWKKYAEEFGIADWEVRSLGDLEDTFEFLKRHEDIEIVVVDEAHRFRNQDTEAYELLRNICRNKIVILLTATPFNNKPEDVLSLIKLFIIPKKSNITLDNNLAEKFRSIGFIFKQLAFIKKYHNSKKRDKRHAAESKYRALFGENIIDLLKVKERTQQLAKEIRDVIEPITIRRNRLDLTKNPQYRDEVKELSKVKDPVEWFYELSKEQSAFYDTVIGSYFADPDLGGRFKGTIYRPFEYEEGLIGSTEPEDIDKESNKEILQQRNLFDIMRRLLVKRFESSFGAFEKSIQNFIRITNLVLDFLKKTGNGNPLKGEYILDRGLLEKIYELDLDEIELKLQEYQEQINKGILPKKHKRYKVKDFKSPEQFLNDINSDLALFEEILKKLTELNLINNDPKSDCLIEHLKKELDKTPPKGEPKRKIVIFSEYADTVNYVLDKFNNHFNDRVLSIAGALPDSKIESINKNFDASYHQQLNEYDILLSTDKISEGFNLNRAGMIVNYDIPWNPVRVIQRLGRINRISKKVFEELYIVNFFPTERGAEFVKSREIAEQKMFMIHNTLGEDSKIFDIAEEPTPADLFTRINTNPDNLEEESFYTKIISILEDIKAEHPDLVKKLKNYPKRIKVAKKSDDDELLVFFRKTRLFVVAGRKTEGEVQTNITSLEEVIDRIRCEYDEKGLALSENFWEIYEPVKTTREKYKATSSGQSLEREALERLEYLIRSCNDENILGYKRFLRFLKTDILEYGTLPEYTLRRIAGFSGEANKIRDTIKEIEQLMRELGEDYLVKEKSRINKLEKEIIVAIENRKTDG